MRFSNLAVVVDCLEDRCFNLFRAMLIGMPGVSNQLEEGEGPAMVGSAADFKKCAYISDKGMENKDLIHGGSNGN